MAKRPVYEIRIVGSLDARRVVQFGDLTVNDSSPCETVITGAFHDQSALYGLLNWIRSQHIDFISAVKAKNILDARRKTKDDCQI